MMSSIKNVAIVGASGNVGKHISSALLATGKHKLTALSRPESNASFAPDITVKKVDYSHSSLVDALKGQDALVISLSAMTPHEQEIKLVDAAAEAGVPWVLNNEWGSDNAHPAIAAIPFNIAKADTRQHIEKLGKSSWIGVVNGPWFEYSLAGGSFGVDIKNRTAGFYDEGEQKTTTTTLPQVGRAVASLLTLPVSGSSPCLSDWKNKFYYIGSFYVSQRDILKSVQRVTGTSDEDWNVTHRDAAEAVQQGHESFKQGNFRGLIDVLYGTNFTPGKGGDYSVTKKNEYNVLNQPDEDLDQVTKKVVQQVEAK